MSRQGDVSLACLGNPDPVVMNARLPRQALRGFTCVQRCGLSRASIPHGLAAKISAVQRRPRSRADASAFWLPQQAPSRTLTFVHPSCPTHLPPRPRPRLQPHTLVPLVTLVPEPSYRLVQEIQPGHRDQWGREHIRTCLENGTVSIADITHQSEWNCMCC